MNRKQKLIISITGITIVMLALLGLTYGYYLTRIEGNTNTNSISITTADLTLVYRDGTGELIANNIMPGDEITSKTFTVKNDGEQDVEAYTVALINIMNDFTFKDDLEVSVSCSSNINSGVCDGFAEDYEDNIYKEKYPAVNSELFSLDIKEGETHTFTLTVDYLYQDFDQSDDMGKTLKGKVQIYDPKDTIEVSGEVTGYAEGDYAEIHSDVQTSEIVNGEYKFVGIPADNHTIYIKNRNTNTEKSTTLEIKKGTTEGTTNGIITFTDTSKIVNVVIDATNANLSTTINKVSDGNVFLKDEIIANAKKNITGRTIYSEIPLTTPAAEISGVNEMTLSKTQDVYGDSYYFRGAIQDNYVLFNNMCWRIVRIQGDGSIKLVFSGEVVNAAQDCSGLTDTSAFIRGGYTELGMNSVNYGINDDNMADYLYSDQYNDTIFLKPVQENWFNQHFRSGGIVSGKLNSFGEKLKEETWCLGGKFDGSPNADGVYEFIYHRNTGELVTSDLLKNQSWWNDWHLSAGKRLLNLKTTSLLCDETEEKFSSFVGSLTSDEVALAGGVANMANANYYLIQNIYKLFWTLSRAYYDGDYENDYVFCLNYDGSITTSHVDYALQSRDIVARPAIVLKSGTKISKGDGTQSNPYVVE